VCEKTDRENKEIKNSTAQYSIGIDFIIDITATILYIVFKGSSTKNKNFFEFVALVGLAMLAKWQRNSLAFAFAVRTSKKHIHINIYKCLCYMCFSQHEL
jgi:hypothetical protein